MSRFVAMLAVLAILIPGLSNAHAMITSTVPADGDFVAPPDVLVLNFDNEVQLTGLELHSLEGVSDEGRSVEGAVVHLGFDADEANQSFTIDVPESLPPGEYYLLWRCIATDSHFASGEFFFTVVDD